MFTCKRIAQALGLKAQPTDSAGLPVIRCAEDEAPCGPL